MLQFPILSVIIFWPILGSFVVLAAYRSPRLVRWLSLGVSLVEMALVAALFCLDLQPHATPQGTWLLLEDYAWIPWLGARYSLGLDGISLLLVLLVAFINIFSVLISWKAIDFKVGSFFFWHAFLRGHPGRPLPGRRSAALLSLLGNPDHSHVFPGGYLGA